MSQPFKLFRLQQIDSQMDQASARLQEIDAILKDDHELNQAQARASDAERRLNEARKALQRAEQEVQAQEIKIEQTEASLYGGKIHNPKELQDLQKEAAALKRYKAVLEDRQLEHMLAVEEGELELQSAKQELESVRIRIETQRAALLAEKTVLQNRLNGLISERQAIASSIEKEDMQLYEQLRLQRKGVAVARVVDKTCAACGSTLTPSQVQSAHSPVQISRCSFCGRILYAG